MVTITGVKRHLSRLDRVTQPAGVLRVGKALFKAGHAIQTEAQLSITRGAVSGKGHVASAPGEAPNNDTSTLANSIETVQLAPLRVRVSANAPYAEALELGTSKSAERPFMKPAVVKKREEITEHVVEAVRRELRR